MPTCFRPQNSVSVHWTQKMLLISRGLYALCGTESDICLALDASALESTFKLWPDYPPPPHAHRCFCWTSTEGQPPTTDVPLFRDVSPELRFSSSSLMCHRHTDMPPTDVPPPSLRRRNGSEWLGVCEKISSFLLSLQLQVFEKNHFLRHTQNHFLINVKSLSPATLRVIWLETQL